MPDDTALRLERHFETAFAAPEGVKKLRELILTLAMQGKLVPQDPTDPPASELLNAIALIAGFASAQTVFSAKIPSIWAATAA